MKDLLERLRGDFPGLRFREGRKFSFRPPRTVVFEGAGASSDLSEGADGGAQGDDLLEEVDGGARSGDNSEHNFYQMRLLHEVGHAVLQHRDYKLDAERVKMERAAWEKARELASRYEIEFDDEVVEMELDTYRDWLHQRSKCPECGLTRYQAVDGEYHCPLCEM